MLPEDEFEARMEALLDHLHAQHDTRGVKILKDITEVIFKMQTELRTLVKEQAAQRCDFIANTLTDNTPAGKQARNLAQIIRNIN